MKKSTLFLIISNLIFTFAYGQKQTIKEIHFPYKSGYEFTMRDSAVKFDKYNFPQETIIQETRYTVSDDPSKKGVLTFKLDVYNKTKDQKVTSALSSLTLNKKGMCWWFDDNPGDNVKPKITNAIKLPLKKGSSWNSIFNDQKAVMTCVATDTVLSTMYGDIPCFGVSYQTILKEDKDYKYYSITREFYNDYAGKVHTEDETYFLIKATNKAMLLVKSSANIVYSNLTDEQKSLIK